MTENAIQTAEVKRKWRWWQMALVVLGGLWVLGMILPDTKKSTIAETAPNTATAEKAAADKAAADKAAGLAAAAAAAAAMGPIDGAMAQMPEARLTGPQQNAVRSATQYLNMTGFSRRGLIDQLSSDAGDGYAVNDATVAVDSLNVDWNEQAARSAKQYLDMTGFSCKGLIEQLSSSSGDQYTTS